jgi:hypothetical protein
MWGAIARGTCACGVATLALTFCQKYTNFFVAQLVNLYLTNEKAQLCCPNVNQIMAHSDKTLQDILTPSLAVLLSFSTLDRTIC